MLRDTTVRSRGAIALGGVFFIGALVVLFWDFVEARSLAGFSQSHVYILLSLAAAYGAGHFMLTSCEWSVGGFLRPTAFAALFVIATSICVGFSGGRTAETFGKRESAASHENAKRLNHEAEIAAAKVDLEKAIGAWERAQATAADKAEAAAVACKDGPGPKCRGATLTSTTASTAEAEALKRKNQTDSHYWMLVGQLGGFKAPQIANANLKQIAKAIAFATGYEEERVTDGVLLYLPYGLALLTEFGSIMFLNYGFSQRSVSGDKSTTDTDKTKVSAQETVSKPRRTRTSAGDGDDVLEALASARRPLSNDELAAALGVSKSEASKRRAKVRHMLREEPDGRHVRISLARH